MSDLPYRYVPLAIVFALAAVPTGEACNVPVFRYALERWQSDPYQLVVLHRGPLSPADAAKVDALRGESLAGSGHCNLDLADADLGDVKSAPYRELWERQNQKDAALPWAVLLGPRRRDQPVTVWAGPLADADPVRLLDSPARKELVKRLAAGESAVWVLVTSGKKKADNQAAKMIAEKTKMLEEEMPLPPGIGEPGSELYSEIPLKIKFSTLKVSRDDPAERVFVDMLIAGQPSLADEKGPLAFVAFGRARVLGGVGGEDLNEDVIMEASAMICGPCSCQMKEMNPGYDLLARAHWDALVTGELAGPHEMPDLKGFSDFVGATSKATPAPVAEATAPPATRGPITNLAELATPAKKAQGGGTLLPSVLTIVVAALVLLGAASAFILRSKKP